MLDLVISGSSFDVALTLTVCLSLCVLAAVAIAVLPWRDNEQDEVVSLVKSLGKLPFRKASGTLSEDRAPSLTRRV